MHRRQYIATGILFPFLGCLRNPDDNTDREFTVFDIVNREEEQITPHVMIYDEGEKLFDDYITVSPETPETVNSYIDQIERRTGNFEVTVSYDGSERTVNVTESSTESEYGIVIIFENDGYSILTAQ